MVVFFFIYRMAPYFVMLKFMFIGYDSIYTIFLSKIFLNLSLFIIIYIYIFGKKNELQLLCIRIHPTLMLRISQLFLLHNFKALLKIMKLIMHSCNFAHNSNDIS